MLVLLTILTHLSKLFLLQRNLTKLNHDHRELEERLKEERSQKEQFKNTKNEIEDERSLLDRTVEKLQREVSGPTKGLRTSLL